VRDVFRDVERLSAEFSEYRKKRWGVLCARVGDDELVPIELTGSLILDPGSRRPLLQPYFDKDHKRTVLAYLKRNGEDVVEASLDKAIAETKKNLTSFLSFRFAAASKAESVGTSWREGFESTRGQSGSKGGLAVTVSCRTHGLRLHIAPSYFRTWVFFGSPTTPVSGSVLPGRYSFASDGPLVDPGVFSIPPTYNPVLTRF